MESGHNYRVVAWWSSGKTGLAKSDSAPNAIHFTAPPQFGGVEGRWTPEDLMLGAVAGCFTTTFRALAEYSKFAYTDLEVEVRPAKSRPRLLDELEGPEGELAQPFEELGGDHRIATVGQRLLADEVAGVDAELDGRLRVGHQTP